MSKEVLSKEYEVEKEVELQKNTNMNHDGNTQALNIFFNTGAKKYFINVFAAYSLGLIEYEDAYKLNKQNLPFYEITEENVNLYNKVFSVKIINLRLRSSIEKINQSKNEKNKLSEIYNYITKDNVSNEENIKLNSKR